MRRLVMMGSVRLSKASVALRASMMALLESMLFIALARRSMALASASLSGWSACTKASSVALMLLSSSGAMTFIVSVGLAVRLALPALAMTVVASVTEPA